MNAPQAKTKQYPGGILTGSAPLQKEAVFSAKVLPLVPSCADYSACVTFEFKISIFEKNLSHTQLYPLFCKLQMQMRKFYSPLFFFSQIQKLTKLY